MIVTGIDFSPSSGAALAWARAAAAFHDDRVLAVHAGPPTAELVAHSTLVEARHDATRARLREVAGDDADVAVSDGPAAAVLVEHAAKAALLVVGRRGLGTIASVLLGSVSRDVVRTAPCPVALVPADATTAIARVVTGTDGSADAETAVRWAAAEAASRDVPLLVVHVVPERALFADSSDGPDAERLLSRAIALARAQGVTVTPYVTRGTPGHALVRVARPDDLLVVGAHGHGTGVRLLIGSTSAYCAEHAPGTVVVVPEPVP